MKSLIDRSTGDFRRHISLAAAELDAIACDLQGAEGVRQRRGSARSRYRTPEPLRLTVNQPGGGVTRTLVYPIDISSGEIRVAAGCFVHANSACTIQLVARDGCPILITGRAIRCAHRGSRCHEVDIKFDSLLDVRPFVDLNSTSVMTDRHKLVGRIIYIDDQAIDREVFRLTLDGTGIELSAVATKEEALMILSESLVDIIITDLDLDGKAGGDAVRAIRTVGFRGPMAILTSESDPVRLQAAKDTGVNEVLRKPCDPDVLLATIADLLAVVGATVSKEPIVSLVSESDPMRRGLPVFLEQAMKAAEDIESAIASNDVQTARMLCQTLRVSSSTFGFPLLGDAAAAGIKALDSSQSVRESLQELRRTVMVTRRLAA